MKKIISLLLVVVTLTLLVGCGAEPQKVEPQKVELSRGTIEGDIYKNNYLGFEFTKPESWVYSTDEEIAQAMNIGAEMLFDDKFKSALENTPTLYDMMVVDSVTRTNMNIGYENLSKTFSSNITVEQYIDALKKQFENVSEMKVTFLDKFDTVKLGQTEFTRVVCDATVYDVPMTQAYYLHKADGYMSFVIVTITKGYTLAEIEAMFK